MYWIFFFLKFLFPQKFLLLDTWKEDLTTMTEDSVKSSGYLSCITENEIFFLKKKVFLPKFSSGHVECSFDDPSGFLPEARKSWAESPKLMEKLSIRKNIFPPKVSSGAVAWKSLAQSQILRGIFFFNQRNFAQASE